MKILDDQYKALKLKDDRCRKLTLKIMDDEIDVVVRPASRHEWRAHKALRNNSDENKSAAANDQLLLNCTLFPDPKTPEFQQLFDRYPALSDTLWAHVAKMAGMTAEVEFSD
jgi:hypothetical protein